MENMYPVYNIPEDFYPDSEIPEHDLSNPETPEPCKEKRFFAFTEKKLEILEALQECCLEDDAAEEKVDTEKEELLSKSILEELKMADKPPA